MFSAKIVLDRDMGLAFVGALPDDDPQTVVWIPEKGDGVTVETFVGEADDAQVVCHRWRRLLADCGLVDIPIAIGEVPDADWATDWRMHFRRERITERLVVCPAWDSYAPPPGEWVVRVDPGMSFGTGQHATTRACLRFMADSFRRGQGAGRFLDIGCGSGILSIAAALMGFETVVAIDNDPQALSDTLLNSERNGVAGRVRCLNTDLAGFRPSGKFDVIAANLLSEVLIEHSAIIADLVEIDPPGDLFVAGILRGQYPDVLSDYQVHGFKEMRSIDDDEWRSGWLRRRSSAI